MSSTIYADADRLSTGKLTDGSLFFVLPKWARRLEELLDEDALTQTEIAQQLSVDKTLISHWKAGRREPSLAQIVWLSERAGVSTDWLLGLSDERRSLHEPPAKLTSPGRRHRYRRDADRIVFGEILTGLRALSIKLNHLELDPDGHEDNEA